MSLPSLGSAMGSRVNSSEAYPGTGRQWYRVLLLCTHTKQAPPESVQWHVNIHQAT